MSQYFGLGGDEPIHDSERIVAEALRRLPDPWVIMHHVTWQSVRNGRQGDGEADFVVIHPKRGAVVLEVKGGGIDVQDGRWFSKDRNKIVHPIKNPYDQATASKHALLEWFADRGLEKHIRIGHAVVLASEFEMPLLGPAATREITLIRPDLDNVEAKLNACFKHWSLQASLTPTEAKQIVRALAPTVSLKKTLRSEAADAEVGLMTLTADQIEALSGLKASRGGLVLGGAGTGKTVLAIARAQQLARDGFRTILVCFNELLGDDLASRLADVPGITACTFHTLCFQEANRAGLEIPPTLTKEWWEETAPEILIEACAVNSSTYDAIVVDEGQDFAPAWIDALRCLSSSTIDAPLFVFADPRQDLWKRNWSAGTEYDFDYTLSRNLRNTQPIAEKVAAVVGIAAHARGVPGPLPRWRTSKDRRNQEGDVVSAVETLLDAGFNPTNLVVLCESAPLATRLRERSVGAYSFGRWGSRGIPVETVARFKGLESEAVVLVLDEGESEDQRTSAYIGMSRARSVLTVVGTQSQQSFLGWSSSGPKS
jgi:hypothetical protein